MPTATAFVSPKLVSPAAHCIESKTTTELDALNRPRYEGTLATILALWWNLYTVDVAVTIGSASTQNRSGIIFRRGQGGSHYDVSISAEATPKSRVCAAYNNDTYGVGLAATHDSAAPLDDAISGSGGDATAFTLWLKRIYYNSTTGNYALVFNYAVNNGPKGDMLLSNASLATSNGGAVSFLGSAVYAGTRPSGTGYADIAISITNPTYYTY